MEITPLPIAGKVLKYLFIIFNVIFALFGLALIGVGAWLIAVDSDFDFLFNNNIIGGAALIIICGGVTFIIAAVGVVGALFQNRIILVIFALCLTLIVVLEIVGAILGFVFQDTVEMEFRRALDRALADYAPGSNLGRGLDRFQETFTCCGANSSNDWIATPYFNNTGMLPVSCCSNTTVSCTLASPSLHMSGCLDATTAFLRENIGYAIALGAVGLVIGLLEILGIILSLVLCFCIHRSILKEV